MFSTPLQGLHHCRRATQGAAADRGVLLAVARRRVTSSSRYTGNVDGVAETLRLLEALRDVQGSSSRRVRFLGRHLGDVRGCGSGAAVGSPPCFLSPGAPALPGSTPTG